MQVEEKIFVGREVTGDNLQNLTELVEQCNQLLHKFASAASSITPRSCREQGFQDLWE